MQNIIYKNLSTNCQPIVNQLFDNSSNPKLNLQILQNFEANLQDLLSLFMRTL